MTKPKDKKEQLNSDVDAMRAQVQQLERALQAQKQIAFSSGIFQKDVTVRTLLESVAEGVVVCDQDGVIIIINKRAEELFGYKVDEVVGRPLNILLPERHFEKHAGHLETFFIDPHIRPMGQGFDLSGKRKDGLEFPVEVSLSYLETEQGVLELAFVTDITKRKEAEWDLKLRNQELDAFAHTVAHDLKASLTTIIGFSEALAETYDDLSEAELKHYLTVLSRDSRRMSNIIDELLVFASVRKEDVVCVPLDMEEIVDNTLQRLNYVIKQYDVEVLLPENFYGAVGYGPWVEEVWYNYITNAAKYGGEPPVIKIGNDVEEGYVRYWVNDNGKGISEENKIKLFEPFSPSEVPRIQGHGLGLSIVKRIVEKLDGQVGVESEVGRGSRFSFCLPRS